MRARWRLVVKTPGPCCASSLSWIIDRDDAQVVEDGVVKGSMQREETEHHIQMEKSYDAQAKKEKSDLQRRLQERKKQQQRAAAGGGGAK